MKNGKTEEEIRKIIEALYPVLSNFRNDLHRNPELCWQEFRTTQKIENILKEYGLPTLVKPLETGGYLDFEYSPDAPYVLLRADIDALPITDLKNTSHASQNNGVCHACGHDVHTTIIVGLGILLKKLNITLPYNIRLVFQPAEEPIPGGASKMIPTGILNNVRYAIGIHVDPRIEIGTISLTNGWVNMQSIRLDLEISGQGGHSAYPFKTQDIIWVASRLIQDSLQMINREFDALYEPLILTFTEIRSGEGYNVIPAKLSLTGTIRVSGPELRERFFEKFQRLLTAYEATSGCKFAFNKTEGAPAVWNDPQLIKIIRENGNSAFFKDLKFESDFRTPGGDDFGYYSKKVSSALIRFGTRKKGYGFNLHTGYFDVPNEVIKTALSFLAYQVMHLDAIK